MNVTPAGLVVALSPPGPAGTEQSAVPKTLYG